MNAPVSERSDNKWIGQRTIRPDGADKVTGRAAYAADTTMPNMIWGKVLRSPHPHAKIRSINTIEGMATSDRLHPLQQKFLEMAALQCGICTPGVLMAAKSLLDRNPDPTEHEVRFWLAGNLCRCTGYDKIVRAVMETAKDMREAVR